MSFSGSIPEVLQGSVTNDGFFPNLDLGEFQTIHRLPAEYSPELISEGVTVSMLEVNNDLQSAKQTWRKQGQTELTTDQAALYKRAVFCRAKSYLLQQYATVTAKPSANNEGKEAPERYDAFLKLSANMVRQLQGRGRIGVELI